ncbi:MAG: hypothetical protein PHS14_06715 [Elusimicrobia bacterium]|nr:hypothetical protein [Elusimicrobiota bacterium]
MDTKKDSAVSGVPTFKVARVGNDRKRKGGGLSFLRGGGTRGVWSGVSGGSGAGGAAVNALGMSFSKVMLTIMLTAGIGSAAVYMGARSAANVGSSQAKKPVIFSHDKDDIKLEGDTSNLPSTANTIPNSLGYLTGSKDGLTPEERAKKEADAAAAAEAQRIADEEAAKKAEKDNLAGKPAVDPAALLASAQADGGKGGKGSAFGKKFGSLSSSMGGGSSLSGGAGLSGGVNRQFGSSGSISKGASGQLSAMKGTSRPSYSKAGGARLAASNTKGFARKQLANANAYSRRGSAASKGETASSDAGTAFDNNPGAGNVISGPGVGNGARPASAGDNTPNPGSSSGNGSPTGGGPVDCGANMYQTADGTCALIPTNNGKDAKPMLTLMANIMMGCLLLIGVIAAIAIALDSTVYGAAISGIVKTAILALGVIVTGLGVAIMAMGDYVTGGLGTLIGGIVSYMAYMPVGLTGGQAMVAGFGGAALSMVGKMLDAGNHKDKAPVAAQQ